MKVRELADAIRKVEVNNCVTQYRNTGDGRYLWQALLKLHQTGEPLPQGLYDKLAQWATAVLAADTSDELAAALEMKGSAAKKKGLSRSRNYTKRWRIASHVMRLRGLDSNLSLKDAIAKAAAHFEETEAMVKRAYYEIFAPDPEAGKDANELAAAMKSWR